MKINKGNNGFSDGNGRDGHNSSHVDGVYTEKAAQEPSFQNIIGRIYRRKTVVIVLFFSVVLISTLSAILQKPVYEATSKVLIERTPAGSGSNMVDFVEPFQSNQRRISDELEILRTNLLRTTVAKQLLDNPTIEVNGRLDTMAIVLERAKNHKDGKRRFASVGEVAARLNGAINFSNIPNTDVINISAKGHSPAEVSHLANVYSEQYYEQNLNSSRAMATNVRKFLGTQLDQTQGELNVAADSLQNYMHSQGIFSVNEEASRLISTISTFEAQRDNVVIQQKTQSQILKVYQAQLDKIGPSLPSDVSQVISPYITMLQQEIAKLQVERDVAVSQNPGLPDKQTFDEVVSQRDAQIANLQKKLREKTREFLASQNAAVTTPQGGLGGTQGNGAGFDMTAYYQELRQKVLQQEIQLNSLRIEEKELNNILEQYNSKFSKIPGQYIELAKLERVEQSRAKLFSLIQGNYQQAEIAEQSQFGNVQIIDPAVPPGGPISPHVRHDVLLGILLGLGLGIGAVFALDYIDNSVKLPEDLEKRGFSVLCVVPTLKAGKRKKASADAAVVKGDISAPRTLVTYTKPLDPASEAYSSLRTAIQYSRIDKPIASVLFVSSLPKEGKSTTVANAGITFANAGLKTLIIDADLRKPIMHKFFGEPRKPGLVEYLKGEIDVKHAIRKTFVDNLFLLTAGSISPNPSVVVGSEAMKAAMAKFKATYDFIIMDSPPIAAVTDGVVLSKLTDAVVFVTLAGKTQIDAIEKGYSTLEQVEAETIGFVLNGFDAPKGYGLYYTCYRSYNSGSHKEEALEKL